MSDGVGVTRRAFLVTSALVGAGGGVALWLRRGEGAQGGAGESGIAIELAGLASDPQAARVLGAAYLATAPAERSEAALSAALFSDPDWRSIDPEDAAAQLRAQVRGDFEADRTIELDGWKLAISEARFCALVELFARSGRSAADRALR